MYLCKVDIRTVSKKLSKPDISAEKLEWWSLYLLISFRFSLTWPIKISRQISCFEWTLKERIIYFSVEIDFSGSEFFFNEILFCVSITIIAIWMTIFTFF